MQDKLYVLPSHGAVTIGAEAAQALITSGDANAALLYIYILRNSGSLSLSEAAHALSFTAAQTDAAARKLSMLGLITLPNRVTETIPEKSPERDELPDYSASDLAQGLEEGGAFRHLVSEAQRRLGKILSNSDLKLLYGLYDFLGLPADVLSLLMTHCVEDAQRRYGAGRMPTMRQIGKEAYIWAHREIDTEERASEYLKKLSEQRGALANSASVLQISGRPLSRSEEKYITGWLDMGFGPEELELAYDKTVLKTRELSWSYMNSILKSWDQKGLHTLTEIKAGDRPAPRSGYAHSGGGNDKTSASNNYEKNDVEWMKQYIQKMKEEK